MISNKYTPLTAKDLVNERNNNKYNWFKEYQNENLGFPAQTVVVSSYGISQIMLPTAFAMGYRDLIGDDGRYRVKSPLDLLKPEVCLPLANRYLARMYIEVNKIDTKNPQLTSLVEYNNNIRNALAAYNGGPTNYLESRQDNYQKSVLKKLSDYRILINFNTPIFE